MAESAVRERGPSAVLASVLACLAEPPAPPPAGSIARSTTMVRMRDGVRLATDIYPPARAPAPTLIMRTPYGRATDKAVARCEALAGRGFAVISQDCRGTGDSEPDRWDYFSTSRTTA